MFLIKGDYARAKSWVKHLSVVIFCSIYKQRSLKIYTFNLKKWFSVYSLFLNPTIYVAILFTKMNRYLRMHVKLLLWHVVYSYNNGANLGIHNTYEKNKYALLNIYFSKKNHGNLTKVIKSTSQKDMQIDKKAIVWTVLVFNIQTK